MHYMKTHLTEELVIKNIIAVHYFEFAKDYVFEGEKHNFWELVYVDKGEVEVMADTQGYKLKQGEMIFHKPNEFHNVWANGKVAPNIIIISFECKSRAMEYFENKILSTGDYESDLLARIVREAREAYSTPLNVCQTPNLKKRDNSLFACEQLIGIHLTLLLIHLIRKGNSIKMENRLSAAAKERSEEDLVKRIVQYLRENLTANLSFNDVCRYSYLSKTNLKAMFKEVTGSSVMEYYKNLKIDEAKKMIRDGGHNFTELADILGYTSIHYFSRHFKKVTGMTPSQYASSLKTRL